MTGFLKLVRSSVKHWYILLFVGVLFIATGLYALRSPAGAFLTLAIVFAVAFTVSGISEIIFSVANRKEVDNWGWTLIFGLVTLVVGVHLLSNPIASMLTLALIVGFILLFRSIAAISYSIDLKNYKTAGWGYLTALGILGTILSFFVIWHPAAGALAVTFWLGLTLMINGVFSILLSLKLRHLHKLPGKVSGELKEKYNSILKELESKVSE